MTATIRHARRLCAAALLALTLSVAPHVVTPPTTAHADLCTACADDESAVVLHHLPPARPRER